MGIGLREASIGFVSTYPPTVCGLASFTAALVNGVAHDRGSRSGLGVVRLVQGLEKAETADVSLHHVAGSARSLRAATRELNSYDTVSIQHEFGIFGGPDGREVIDLVSGLTVPVAVTFHTMLDHPTEQQRLIISRLVERADRMVVMSETASRRLIRSYAADPLRIEVIPHGADPLLAGPSLVKGDRPLVLTWGLIGPGKGLESVIEAVADLVDLEPRPRYLIAGATHPNVLASAGESYRNGLFALVDRHGLAGSVEFDDRYLDRQSLARMVRSADLVVLPYASVEQSTSGVLVEAIAASKPVIATRFPHAVELLANGVGVTVPHSDPAELSAALRRLLTDHKLRWRMSQRARRLADGWYWPTIGRRFATMMSHMAANSRLVGPRSAPSELTRAAG